MVTRTRHGRALGPPSSDDARNGSALGLPRDRARVQGLADPVHDVVVGIVNSVLGTAQQEGLRAFYVEGRSDRIDDDNGCTPEAAAQV